jgi:hypothetical protein
MDFWNTYWLDVGAFVLTTWLLIGALTGKFYTGGRGGGHRLVASTNSRSARLLFLVLAVGIVAWLIIDLGRKISRCLDPIAVQTEPGGSQGGGR